MVFSIICLGIVALVVTVIVQDRRDKMPWGGVAGEVAGALTAGVCGGVILLLLCAGVSGFVIDPDTGWETTAETVVTVAEGSDIVVDGRNIEFVGSKDGKLTDVDLYVSESVVYAEDSKAPRTVEIREEHRELGTALIPWGVGDDKTTATIR